MVMGIGDKIGNGNGKEWERTCMEMGMAIIPMGTWASIIGWTGGQVPPLFEVGGRNVFCPPIFGGQQIFIMCKFTIFLLLILRQMDMDISLRG